MTPRGYHNREADICDDVKQGFQTPARGPDPARQAISSGPPAPQNVAKGSIDLNGPPQRLPLPLATGFVLLIHVFHIILRVVQSFNVMETEFKSASNALLRNTWNFKDLSV